MNILKIVPRYPPPILGGLEKQASLLAQALVDKGHTVTVLTDSVSKIPAENGTEAVKGTRPRVIRFGIRGRPCLFSRVVFLVQLFWFIWRTGKSYHICHIHNISLLGGFSVLLCKLIGLPSLVKVPNVGSRGIKGFTEHHYTGFLRKWLLRRADGLIALSAETVIEAEEIGIPTTRVYTIHNGISLRGIDEEKSSYRQDDLVTFIFVGRMYAHKGVPELIAAWKSLKKQVSNIRLLLVGDGPEAFRLRKDKSIFDDESIQILGQRSDVLSLLRQSDVFVLPSYHEGNSNAILEAMASGLPIVSTRVGGTPELVGPEGAAFLCSPGDLNDLARSLLAFGKSAVLRKTIGESMRRRCISEFGIDKIALKYVELYKRLSRQLTEENLRTN